MSIADIMHGLRINGGVGNWVKYSAEEAIDKIKAYEEKLKEYAEEVEE